MTRTGRPKKEIDKGQFEKLFIYGFAKETIAKFFDVSVAELEKTCLSFYGMTFEQIEEAVCVAIHPNKNHERPYSVYMHISPSGKKYIGITRQTFSRRWQNGNGYWSNEHFTNAIKKYGWNEIKHAILFLELTKSEAEEKERELIKRFNTTDRRYGYNIEGGGGLHKEVSKETREKLSRKALGVRPNDEIRKKMSESHKGEKCHFFGTHLSNERKEKLRVLKSKPVERLDDFGNVLDTYPSMKEAARVFGVTRQAIESSCSGRRKRCAGYVWRWS